MCVYMYLSYQLSRWQASGGCTRSEAYFEDLEHRRVQQSDRSEGPARETGVGLRPCLRCSFSYVGKVLSLHPHLQTGTRGLLTPEAVLCWWRLACTCLKA